MSTWIVALIISVLIFFFLLAFVACLGRLEKRQRASIAKLKECLRELDKVRDLLDE